MNNFRAAREAKGFLQKEVADALGVKTPNISRWETGVNYPEVEKLIRLARLYGTSTDYLLGLDEGQRFTVTEEEKELLRKYRCATADTCRAVRAVLGMQEKERPASAG